MTDRTQLPERLGLTRRRRLTPTAQAAIGGLAAGLGLFVATNWVALMGGEVVRRLLVLLGQAFVGYSVSFVGSLMGLVYGFIFGFCATYWVVVFYTSLADLNKGPHQGRA